MTRKPKLFITSSNRAKIIAHQLETSLICRDIDACILDVDNNSFHIGENTLDKLLRAGRSCDFAAVILTQDDILTSSNNPNLDLLCGPRDNCIVELGFFLGALNLEPQRCFFVTSVSGNALPSDFQENLYYKVDEPTDWNALKQGEKDTIEKVSSIVAERVAKLSGIKEQVHFSVITNEQLIELEEINNINRIQGTSKNPISHSSLIARSIAATGLTLSRRGGMGNFSRCPS